MTDTTDAVRLAKEALELWEGYKYNPTLGSIHRRESKLAQAVLDLSAEVERLQARVAELVPQCDAAYKPYRAMVLEARVEVDKFSTELAAMKTPVTWKQLDFEDGDTWECSGCKEMTVWEFDPEENVKYCQSCGHPVVFERYIDPVDDDDEGEG